MMSSSVQKKRIIINMDLPIIMLDDMVLREDIYRPDTKYRQPATLCRLPYNKENPLMNLEGILPLWALEAGFAIVFQDTRGRYQSDGTSYPFIHEGQDGYNTVEWITSQCGANTTAAATGETAECRLTTRSKHAGWQRSSVICGYTPALIYLKS